MKKIVSLICFCILSMISFGQKTATIAQESLLNGKKSNSYVFGMPADITAAQVDGVKGYYKTYFTATLNEKTHELTVVLSSNEESNKRVINRMMVSLDVRSFSVNGKEMDFENLFQNHLK